MLMLSLIFVVACRQDMHDQPRYEPLTASDFFSNGMSARPMIEGTVARGELRADEAFYTGRVESEPITELPITVDRATLERGRNRFDIFCSPCHGRLGDGDGMAVERGFRSPPSFHIDRLREAAVGHYYDVITNGFGAMASYASRIRPEDRWAIIAYVRALQFSQNATVDDVPAAMRGELEAAQ